MLLLSPDPDQFYLEVRRYFYHCNIVRRASLTVHWILQLSKQINKHWTVQICHTFHLKYTWDRRTGWNHENRLVWVTSSLVTCLVPRGAQYIGIIAYHYWLICEMKHTPNITFISQSLYLIISGKINNDIHIYLWKFNLTKYTFLKLLLNVLSE